MTISKLQIAIGAIFLTAVCSVFTLPDVYRADVTYIAQFLVLLLGIVAAREDRSKAIGLTALLLADALYYLFVYKLGVSTDSIWVVMLTSTLFGLSFGAFVFILARGRGKELTKLALKPLSIPAVLFFVAVSALYILAPAAVKATADGLRVVNLSHAITLIFSLPLVIVSYLALTKAQSSRNQGFLAGLFIIGVLDIGIQLETIKFGNLAFTYYDLLWFASITTISLFASKADLRESFVSGLSLTNLVKNVFFIAGLTVVTSVAIIFRSELSANPMYFIFTVVTMFLVGLLCANAIQISLDQHAKILKSDFSENLTEKDQLLLGTPLELRSAVSDLLDAVLLKESEAAQSERAQITELESRYKKMAHDIASPVSIIQLLSKSNSEMSAEKLELIAKASARMQAIAQDVLKKDTLKLQMPRISIRTLIDELHEAVEEKTLEFGRPIISLAIDGSLALGQSVQAEAAALRRILSNLLNNSHEALKEVASPLIEISVVAAGANVTVKIRDNGSGFLPEMLRHDLASPRSAKPGGHGIGLSSAKQLVEQWGGRLRISNSEGAKVEIALKCAPAEFGNLRIAPQSLKEAVSPQL